jgi:transcriptional regulator of arginine metabolism
VKSAISAKFHSLFTETVTGVDYSGNIVVVKCLSGMASAVCAAMDSLRRTDIVGTISGDDTFLCVMKDENKSVDLVTDLKKLMRKN